MTTYTQISRHLLLATITFCLVGCAFTSKTLLQPSAGPRKLVVFFDGTTNNEVTDTNIKKLHSLVTLQQRSDIAAIYIEGVGAGGKLIGMATGWGMGARIKKAYIFLLENYQQGDEIYLFGFSRGAYAARILAALLYYAGLPTAKDTNSHDLAEQADVIYDAYKGNKKTDVRMIELKRAFSQMNLSSSQPVRVKIMGLWDTVDALGLPAYEDTFGKLNKLYGDQMCNVEHAYHAVSIDDNRARIFTPVLLTSPQLFTYCSELLSITGESDKLAKHIDTLVDEVWFSGSHADVGGGYADSLLSGVSLNWMIEKLRDTKLLPIGASVPEDRLGRSHDPRHGFPWVYLYKDQSRALRYYAESGVYNTKKPKLHRSVIERLAVSKPKNHEYFWLEATAYPMCFKETPNGYHYIESTDCFDISGSPSSH